MTEKASEKQVKWLKEIGMPDAENKSKEEAKAFLGMYTKLGKDEQQRVRAELQEKKELLPKPKPFSERGLVPINKNTTMYVSYAKDIYLQLRGWLYEEMKNSEVGVDDTAVMERSVKLVKQAIDAFS